MKKKNDRLIIAIVNKAKALRKIHNLSLAKAAKRIGTDKAYLYAFEQATVLNPTLHTLQKIAQGYGVSIHKLLECGATTKSDLHPLAQKVALLIDEALK